MTTPRVIKVTIEIDGNVVYEGKSFIEGLAALPNTITLPKVAPVNQIKELETLTLHEAWDEVFNQKISKFKLYEMVRKKKIPHFRIGSKIFFNRSTLEIWKNEQPPSK